MPHQPDEPNDYPDIQRYRAAMDRYPRCACGQQLWAPESITRGYCEHCQLHQPPSPVSPSTPEPVCDGTELVRVPASYLQRFQPEEHTSEMRKYKHAYQTPDGRLRIERYYGWCGGGWRIDDDTTAGTFDPLTITSTLSAAKVALTEWAL